MSDTFELETPLLLLAMPQVRDPFFQQSVVLLIHHQPEGSLGFIVNRPTSIKISEILRGLELNWKGDENLLAFFGGPVQSQLGTVIFRQADYPSEEQRQEVFPGAVMSQQIGDLEILADLPPGSFRLFLGYSGWGDGQLMQEILRNDWITAPVRDDLVFGEEPERVWFAALESVGVDPAQLPRWTPGSDEPAN